MSQLLKENKLIRGFVSWFGLFGSFGTLLCCAIPSALVLLGFGATLATLVSKFPQLVWASENKIYIFGFSSFMLAASFVGTKYSQKQVCPIEKKDDCEKTKDWSRPLFFISLGIHLIGSFYAFVLPRLMD